MSNKTNVTHSRRLEKGSLWDRYSSCMIFYMYGSDNIYVYIHVYTYMYVYVYMIMPNCEKSWYLILQNTWNYTLNTCTAQYQQKYYCIFLLLILLFIYILVYKIILFSIWRTYIYIHIYMHAIAILKLWLQKNWMARHLENYT